MAWQNTSCSTSQSGERGLFISLAAHAHAGHTAPDRNALHSMHTNVLGAGSSKAGSNNRKGKDISLPSTFYCTFHFKCWLWFSYDISCSGREKTLFYKHEATGLGEVFSFFLLLSVFSLASQKQKGKGLPARLSVSADSLINTDNVRNDTFPLHGGISQGHRHGALRSEGTKHRGGVKLEGSGFFGGVPCSPRPWREQPLYFHNTVRGPGLIPGPKVGQQKLEEALIALTT